MRVLFDISHAGQVHFFKNTIKMLDRKDYEYIIVIKEKDSVISLLEENGLKYISLGKYNSNLEKLMKIPGHTLKIRNLIKEYDIDRVLGVHPVHGSLATKGLKTKCIGFSDTDHAFEQMVLYWPFCDEIYTSYAFRHRFGSYQKLYYGFHELAYLHPNYFTPSKQGIEHLFDSGSPILYRMINWDATHDLSFRNYKEMEVNLVLKLAKKYPVILSSEGDHPAKLDHLVQDFPKSRLHDILYYSFLYLGAGATTAIESSILGTPAIYTNPLSAGVLEFLTNHYPLFNKFPNYLERQAELMSMIEDFESRQNYDHHRQGLLDQSIDVKKLVDALALNDRKAIDKLLQKNEPSNL